MKTDESSEAYQVNNHYVHMSIAQLQDTIDTLKSITDDTLSSNVTFDFLSNIFDVVSDVRYSVDDLLERISSNER